MTTVTLEAVPDTLRIPVGRQLTTDDVDELIHLVTGGLQVLAACEPGHDVDGINISFWKPDENPFNRKNTNDE